MILFVVGRMVMKEKKPLSQLYTGWQEMLAEHRQIIVQVQEIAEKKGWREPEEPLRVDVAWP